MTEGIHVVPKVIFVPKREVVRLGNRWIIYLPMDYNEVWEAIKKQERKVKVYIEVVEE